AAPEGVPDRRLRLVEAGHRPAGRDPVADLPGPAGQRRVRRQAARPVAALAGGRAEAKEGAPVVTQRRRMLDAIVASVAEKGFADTTVADVVARAGVSR